MIRISLTFAATVFAFFLAGCANPAADKSKALTSDAAPVTQQSPKGDRYLISSDTSKIEFVGSKVTGHHNGSLKKFNGEIDDSDKPETSRVSVTIDMNSVMTDTDQVTNHL